MPPSVIGWDIGGAHVKAAEINRNGELVRITQQPCPLWKGLEQLRRVVDAIRYDFGGAADCNALTMTGELVDLFAGRDEGVRQIIATMRGLLPDCEILVFAGSAGLLPAEQVRPEHYQAIASANWLASAALAANAVAEGLFIDIGSTTTDILVLNNGRVLAEGHTDYQRLISQELVYTGVVRTPVMAVAQTVIDEDREIGLMAEYFATMADVYRVTGELDEAHDQCDTADGAEKSVTASARRLARMIGCDFTMEELPRWRRLAQNIRAAQFQKLQHACETLGHQRVAPGSPLIGAGIGRFLAEELAIELGYRYLDFSSFLPNVPIGNGLTAADCAPAAAVAKLAEQWRDSRRY